MTEQEDPYELNPDELTTLVQTLMDLFKTGIADDDAKIDIFTNYLLQLDMDSFQLQDFLRHRRDYLLSELPPDESGDPHFRVRNRLNFDIYMKNYAIFAEDILAVVDSDNKIRPIGDTGTIVTYHPDGLSFAHEITLVASNTFYDYEANELRCSWNTQEYTSEGTPPTFRTSVVHTFTLNPTDEAPLIDQKFVSTFKPQQVDFQDVPAQYQEVLGQPAFITGFFEYYPPEGGDINGRFNLLLKYIE